MSERDGDGPRTWLLRRLAEIVAHTDISSYPTGTGEFRFRGEAGSWAEHCTDDDSERFRSMVGDLVTELGYSY
jgi:hypothetical protein